MDTPELRAAAATLYTAWALVLETLSGAVSNRANVGLNVVGLFPSDLP